MPKCLPWRSVALAAMVLATVALAACNGAPEPVEIGMTNGQGEIAGEVTTTSVILQSRLTSKAGLVAGDLPGMDGVARFEVSTSQEFSDPITTDWLQAVADGDHIVKAKVDGLTPGTEYLYRVVYGPDPDHTEVGAARSFRTHAGAAARSAHELHCRHRHELPPVLQQPEPGLYRSGQGARLPGACVDARARAGLLRGDRRQRLLRHALRRTGRYGADDAKEVARAARPAAVHSTSSRARRRIGRRTTTTTGTTTATTRATRHRCRTSADGSSWNRCRSSTRTTRTR